MNDPFRPPGAGAAAGYPAPRPVTSLEVAMSGELGRQSGEEHPGWDFTPDELEFLKAMERYQRRMRRRYPTWREVLAVLRGLGYRKVTDPPPTPDQP